MVAIRIWLPGTQVLARIKSDSLSALRSMVKLASSSPALALIAREIALDSVLGLYTVGIAVHIPGVSNMLPDDLSRMWAPEPHEFPSVLVGSLSTKRQNVTAHSGRLRKLLIKVEGARGVANKLKVDLALRQGHRSLHQSGSSIGSEPLVPAGHFPKGPAGIGDGGHSLSLIHI